MAQPYQTCPFYHILPQDLHTMTLTTIHVWLLLLTWPTPAKHRHCSAMAAILQCAQWTTF